MNCCSLSRFSGVAGNGNQTGSGGGRLRFGQSHSCVSGKTGPVSPIWLLVTSPIDGKLSVMSPRLMHASLLRNSLLQFSATYVICLVSTVRPDGCQDDSIKNGYPFVVSSVYPHGDRDWLISLETKLRDNVYSCKVTLASGIS